MRSASVRGAPRPGPARSTVEGRVAWVLAPIAVALGILAELARDDIPGLYRLAFLTAVVAGLASLVALGRGDRSLPTVLALLPFAVVVAFGVSQLLG